MNLATITSVMLKLYMPNETEQKELLEFIKSVILKVQPLQITSWAKFRKAMSALKKIKIPDNIKSILIHLVLENLKNRGVI